MTHRRIKNAHNSNADRRIKKRRRMPKIKYLDVSYVVYKATQTNEAYRPRPNPVIDNLTIEELGLELFALINEEFVSLDVDHREQKTELLHRLRGQWANQLVRTPNNRLASFF